MQPRNTDHDPVLAPALAIGGGFAALTLVTHAANFGFVAAAGRLLSPADFAALVALLGVVLIGLAPGLALQAVTAAGVLGQPVLVDRDLARRLGLLVAAVVTVLSVGAFLLLDLDEPLALLAVPLAAALLPRTAVNEGLLQGHRRFLALGAVMASGAVAKLVLGIAAMVIFARLGWALVAVAIGYALQTWLSRRAAAGRRPRRDARHGLGHVAYAIAVMGGLLVLLHLDGVLAPSLLDDRAAGQYGVGVTAARATFWLPQFAVLLWYPRMVARPGSRTLAVGIGGSVALGSVGAAAAGLLGPTVASMVFGPELGAIGPDLWLWVWLGTAVLVLQLLTLADLASGRRRAWALLVPALVGVAVLLPVSQPRTAAEAVTIVAVVCTVVAITGAGLGLVRGRT